jgi:hypothetical protein
MERAGDSRFRQDDPMPMTKIPKTMSHVVPNVERLPRLSCEE